MKISPRRSEIKFSFLEIMKKFLFFTLIILSFLLAVSAQEKPKVPAKKIQIVLLGTFHYGATSDPNKPDFDALAPKRQTEINQVVELLAKYNPDKIFVEHEPSRQAKWDKIYEDFKKGIEPTGNDLINEIFQLGIKTAKKNNKSSGVICVDYQVPTDFETALKNAKDDVERGYIRQVQAIKDAPEPKNTNENFLFAPFPASKDFKILKLADTNLRDYYLWQNSPEAIIRNHYINDHYLALAIGENENYVGAEYESVWYNRNLKILTNILRTASSEDNRYLLIIGAGHVKTLQDFFSGNPYFEVTSVESILKK